MIRRFLFVTDFTEESIDLDMKVSGARKACKVSPRGLFHIFVELFPLLGIESRQNSKLEAVTYKVIQQTRRPLNTSTHFRPRATTPSDTA